MSLRASRRVGRLTAALCYRELQCFAERLRRVWEPSAQALPGGELRRRPPRDKARAESGRPTSNCLPNSINGADRSFFDPEVSLVLKPPQLSLVGSFRAHARRLPRPPFGRSPGPSRRAPCDYGCCSAANGKRLTTAAFSNLGRQ